jgi:hypothetical protein
VRKLLGHQTLNMTQYYARIYDATVEQQFGSATEAAEAIEGIYAHDWPVPAMAAQPAPSSTAGIDSL